MLEERGVAAMFEAVSLDQQLQPRILGQVGGERLLTDLRHIAQVMHEAALEGQLGLTALLVWLRRRREEAAREGGQERSRRLETDAAAVQVITVHTSKGLEFPVVMVPFAWDNWGGREPATAVFHDEHDHRVRDVGGPGSPDWAAHVRQHKQEETDDELRLTYVALTRAQSHLLLWWAPSFNTPTSPLHRLLLHDDPAAVAPLSITVPDDATALAAFRARADRSNGGLGVEVVQARPPEVWAPAVEPAPALQLATFTRALDIGWRRTSYSALTSAAHEQRLGSEPEVAQKDDEADLEEVPADATLLDVRAARRRVGVGRDPRRRRLRHAGAHRARAARRPGRRGGGGARRSRPQVARFAPDLDADALTTGLLAALATPLGDLADGAALPTYRPRTGCPSSTSSCRWPAATRRVAAHVVGVSATRSSRTSCRCGARTCRPVRCRRTPMRWPSCRTCRCAATSPAASTPCCGSAHRQRRATSSSTTRPTGWAGTTSR